MITFYLTEVLGSGTEPLGASPWLSASFDDHDEEGSVTLTLSCMNLTDDEFVSKWLFNLDPELNPRKLKFSSLLKTGSFITPMITTGANYFTAGGGDKFDILFRFATRCGHSKRFDADDSMTLTISGIPELTAQSFDFDSQRKCGCHSLSNKTEAHIQGIGRCGHGSGWVIVPEPDTSTLALCALLVIALYCQRRRF